MTTAAIVIPFRDRGHDPLRSANFRRVLNHWEWFGPPPVVQAQVLVVSDGRSGDEQFNRSAAYNSGQAQTDADVLVFYESDMLVPHSQIAAAIELAAATPGLVVPFDTYRALTEKGSKKVRLGYVSPEWADTELEMTKGHAVGAVNVVSRQTLQQVGGYDESFAGSWYDDNAMRLAFEMCAGPTRWVPGPGHHLFHLPAHTGTHLSDADRETTERNAQRYELYKQATTPERIRELTAGTS